MSIGVVIACIGLGGGVIGSVFFDGLLMLGRFRESKKTKRARSIKVIYTVVQS